MKSLFFAISTFIYNSPWNINIVLGAQTRICITTERKVLIVRVLMDERDCPRMTIKIAGDHVMMDECDCPHMTTKIAGGHVLLVSKNARLTARI